MTHGPTWACEVVGPPGVGKSTVIEALAREHDVRTIGKLKAAVLPLARSAVSVLVRGLRERVSRPRTMQEFRWMTRLSAAGSLVDGQVVFDQGPVYTIARLTGVAMRNSAWLDGQTKRWSALIDLIVLLDAPDDVLISRIAGRTKTHALKGENDGDVRAAMAKWRSLYAHVVADMTSGAGPSIIRIDTTTTSPSEAAALIVAARR